MANLDFEQVAGDGVMGIDEAGRVLRSKVVRH